MTQILTIWKILIIPIFLSSLIDNYQSSNANIVYTKLGKIKGDSSKFKTRLGKQIFAYRGIRYAEPPVGDLRFKNPVPVKSWNPNIFDATEEGPACPQPRPKVYNASEDCLRLNIYTTKNPNNGHSVLPVIVYFHAGGFYSVSGQSLIEGPQYWLDRDIILVTVNYRLASLGFLSTGDKYAPGNFGLKDQVFALRFVNEHIRAFGGDPSKITIVGYSAGGISVGLHLVSPMSKGLFHRAIAMSGSPTATWTYDRDQKHLAIKQAQLLNCPTRDQNSEKIVQCLKTKEAEEISTTFSAFQELGSDPIIIWKPVIEPEFGGERFLTEDPNKLIKEGKYMKVPLMTGVTEQEFSYEAYSISENETMLNLWNTNFSYTAPIAFLYERDTPKSKEISNSLRKFYLGDAPISDKNIESLGQAYADGVIGFSVNRLVNLIAQTNLEPVYYYKFSYKGRYSHYTIPNTNQTIGPVHHDDLIYLFFIEILFPFFGPNDPETAVVEQMTMLWSNFAKYGNPTPANRNNTIWEPYNINSQKYMNIGENLELRSNMFSDRYALWDKLIPLPK